MEVVTPVRSPRPCAGFTLVELMAALVLISILTGIAVNAGLNVSTTSKNKEAIARILILQTQIDEYAMVRNELPLFLEDVGAGDLVDPWGRSYQYLPIKIDEEQKEKHKKGKKGKKGKGKKPVDDPVELPGPRKDRFLVPINTLYDLYSVGADGETRRSLGEAVSQDDILMANDGAFVGLAREF